MLASNVHVRSTRDPPLNATEHFYAFAWRGANQPESAHSSMGQTSSSNSNAQQKSFLTSLGEDFLLQITAKLDDFSLTRLSQTCRALAPPCVTVPATWLSWKPQPACRDGLMPWREVFRKLPWSVQARDPHPPQPTPRTGLQDSRASGSRFGQPPNPTRTTPILGLSSSASTFSPSHLPPSPLLPRLSSTRKSPAARVVSSPTSRVPPFVNQPQGRIYRVGSSGRSTPKGGCSASTNPESKSDSR